MNGPLTHKGTYKQKLTIFMKFQMQLYSTFTLLLKLSRQKLTHLKITQNVILKEKYSIFNSLNFS